MPSLVARAFFHKEQERCRERDHSGGQIKQGFKTVEFDQVTA